MTSWRKRYTSEGAHDGYRPLPRWPAEPLANAQSRRQAGIVQSTLEMTGVDDEHLDVG